MSNPNAYAGEHAEALAALDQIESLAQRASGGADATALSFAPGNACSEYQRVKPFLQTIIPFVSKIPVYGPKIATALQLLMGIGDQLCHAGGGRS